MKREVAALQEEVQRLTSELDERDERIAKLEALLREALFWAPRNYNGAGEKQRIAWCDLGNRIDAELEGRPE